MPGTRGNQQRAMPGLYWIAFVLVVGLALPVMLVLTVDGIVRGESFKPLGLVFWDTATYLVVWHYGWKKAYQLRIVEDALEWRAPLRRRCIPLTELARANVEKSGFLGEWQAHLSTTSDDVLAVAVRDYRQADQFAALCEMIGRQVPEFLPPT
jgi:hypothetical protein